MENFNFDILEDKIKIYPYLDFSYKQKVQLLKAVTKDLDTMELNYLANPDFSSKKMGLLISIFNSKINDDIREEIFNNKNLNSEQLLEIRRSIRNNIPKSILVEMINKDKSEKEMYDIRSDFLGKNNEEKEIQDR